MELGVAQKLFHVLLNVIQAIHFLLIRHEHVRVDLMNENLILDVLVNGAACFYDVSQLDAVTLVILWLRIDHVDKCATVLDGLDVRRGGLLQVVSPREVLYCELDVGIIIYQHIFDLGCRGQEECLMGRHLLEDYFRNGSFSRSITS